MKKGILLALVLVCGMSSVTRASFDATSVSSMNTSCIASQSHDISYYIPKGTDAVKFQPYDEFASSSAKILSTNHSKVEIWNPNGVIGSDCNQWSYLSNVYPGNNVWVLYLASNTKCSFSRPNYTKASDPNKVDAQIHYALRYYDINSSSSNKVTGKFEYTTVGGFTSNPKQYTCYPGGTTVSTPSDCPNSTLGYDSTMKSHDGECLNYRIFWCGDGIVNNPNGTKNFTNGTSGEECDPNDPNKAGWNGNGKTCNENCKLETVHVSPACDSEYNGKTKYTTTSDPWLTAGKCSTGTPKGFTYSGTPRTFTWSCENDGETVDGCVAYQQWCGDGKKNGSEECDPNDTSKEGWGDKTCNASCKLETIHVSPACDSEYNGKTQYTTTSDPWLTSGKCSTGTPKGFTYSGTPRTFTWSCENDGETVDGCIAYQQWCGDGKKNGSEECDPNDTSKEGWGDKTCNASCKLEDIPPEPVEPKCDSEYNGKTKYTATSDPWLTSGKCNPGTATEFTYSGSPRTFTWSCVNDGITVQGCTAYQEWCGDGKKNGTEECDPNDTSKEGWGNKNCSASCTLTDIPATKYYDLALTKYISGTQTTYNPGDSITFTITVYNQGDYDATNIEVTEYIPTGLKLDDPHWVKDGNKATYFINNDTIKPGEKKDIELKMVIDSDFTGKKILNKAEISKDNSDDYNTTDKDSIPDQDSEDDCIVGEDNHYINGDGKLGRATGDCKASTDEDDHDVVPITIKQPEPDNPPYIEKDLQGDKEHLYQVGELVAFKMPFGNTGDKKIIDVSIKDILPLNLEYVESSIYGVTNSAHGTYMSGKQTVLEYSGFDLAPGQTGYLLMTGRVLSTDPENRVNWVGIYGGGKLFDYDTEPYKIGRGIKIEKAVDKTNIKVGEEVTYTITISALRGEYTGAKVTDILPRGIAYVDGTWKIDGATTTVNVTSFGTGMSGDQSTLIWNIEFPNKLSGEKETKDSFKIVFKAKLVENVQNIYTNVACINTPEEPERCDGKIDITGDEKMTIKKYVSKDSDWTKDGSYNDDKVTLNTTTNERNVFFKIIVKDATAKFTGFKVTDSLDNSMYTLLTGDTFALANNAFTGVMTKGSENTGSFTYEITPKVTQNGNNTDLEWNIVMTSGSVFMTGDELKIIFKAYKVRDNEDTNTAYVYYPKSDGTTGSANDPAKVNRTCLTNCGGGSSGGGGGGGGSSCGDGKQNGLEACDLGKSGGVVKDGVLFSNQPTRNNNTHYNGWTCTKHCTLEKDSELLSCMNLKHGNISIMKGEMLPFYWNMEGWLGIHDEKEKQNYLKENFFVSTGNTCTKDNLNHIDLRTLECDFAIRGPNNKVSSKTLDNPVYTFSAPCVGINDWVDSKNNVYPVIESFIAQNQNGWFGGSMLNGEDLKKNVFATLDNWNDYPELLPVSSKLLIKSFGEGTKDIAGAKNIVSKPITEYGEYKVQLLTTKYKTCIEEGTGYVLSQYAEMPLGCSENLTVTDPYIVQKSVYGLVSNENSLRNYKLLNGNSLFNSTFSASDIKSSDYAVPEGMKSTFDKFLAKYNKLAKSSAGLPKGVRKVPGKSVYIVDGEEPIKLRDLGIASTNIPFTLIASQGAEIIIDFSLSSNAMIMTKGFIRFDEGCNGSADYGHAGQFVKGIFYAEAGFDAKKVRNTNLYSPEWCNYYNVHIKGVAIGDLTRLKNNRRSELYTWFNADSAKVTEAKKNIVINGASVLIEYNPDLDGQLPPGAEEFNKALDVYRS